VSYSWSFLTVAAILVLTPGADFAVIVRNTVKGGRRFGVATTLGVSAAAALQGLLVSVGIANLIVGAQPAFLTIKWLGICYLAFIACGSLRRAVRGEYREPADRPARSGRRGFQQGFVCNATNPKILVFYLALLPQFVGPAAPWWAWLAHAWTLPVLGTAWCLLVVVLVDRSRTWLTRRPVRRALDATTGLVLLGFCARLAREH
jgi:threonine/homoserine/homoserine lactone efflux protein